MVIVGAFRFAIAVSLCVATAARADGVDDLVAQGEALAKQSDYTRAIDAFKKADAIRPRAKHACLIGLVYTRRELWPEAELFFTLCRARATADDPLPPWIGDAEQQLAAKLAETGAAAVTIKVRPLDARVSISVSSFAPDEAFPPRTIHLARGRHVLEVSAPGYASVSREVVVETGDPQTVEIELQTTQAAAEAAARARRPIVLREPPRSNVPLYLALGGLALGLGGGAFDYFVVKPQYDKLSSAPTDAVFDRSTGAYRTDRDVAVAMYAGAAAAVVTGVVLRFTVYAHAEPPVRISGALDPRGAIVTIGWSR